MEHQSETESILKMIADHMENGFLENIIDMFKHDKIYYPLIGDLLGDERSRVRVGTVALVETLKTEDADHILQAIPGVAELLKKPNATIRGDAAYLLGIIGHKDAIPFLEVASHDENELVRETAEEAIEAIKKEG
jgi:HEAT repeat protein